MSKRLSLAGILLITTCLIPPAALAQVSGGNTPPSGAAANVPTTSTGNPTQDEQETDQAPDVSVPGGGDIVVTGRRRNNPVRTSPQVVSVLSSEDIARTGEGDIAGALARVTGLSVVGNGFVYVRGLGDRYSSALLNGSPLPSPEPLKRVVPLDIFPTDVIASSLVQKSYSANFPGEFGGGIINLTTKSAPSEPFLSLSGSIGGDSYTTAQNGYTYYGSRSDWTGYDNGTRDIPGPLRDAFASGNPIQVGADFTRDQLVAISSSLENARTSVLQRNNQIPVNYSGNLTGGTTVDVGSTRIGVIATAGIGNTWRTRQTLQQFSLDTNLSNTQTDFDRVVTDNRVVVNGLLGVNAEFGENVIRWTNLYIRDTVKQSSLRVGTDANRVGQDIMVQNTGWYERQLINTQLVGEFDFGDFDLDARGSYANSQREAPYERRFRYVRTNVVGDPTGNKFINDLGGSTQGEAAVAFSDLNEDLWSSGLDLTYAFSPALRIGGGYAFQDTKRNSVRRELAFRGSNLPSAVTQLRPDYLLSDQTLTSFNIVPLETTAQEGTAAFDAALQVHAGYFQVVAQPTTALNVTAGVRFEKGKQSVTAIDLFGNGTGQFDARLNNDYWLPALTVTYELAPQMQLRASGSKTIARPQFRELINQPYTDTDTNRLFRGNPDLQDSQLYNAEARFEYYPGRDERFAVAGFYKRIDKPTETYSSVESSDIVTSFATAPEAQLYGAEVEAQKYVGLESLGGAFATRRLVLIGNYTFTKSKLKVGADDTTVVNNTQQAATNFFRDGAPLTGQSDHLVNVQLGFEEKEGLSQQTVLLSYASKRVTSRSGVPGQPDVYEYPGFRLDFVAREGVMIGGVETELKLEARNITSTKYQEYQQAGDQRIYFNRYDVGASVSVGLGVKF